MRTRSNLIVTALVLLSLVSGAIGCKHTGGPWYKTSSYSSHNPFKSKDDTLEPYSRDYAKPSIGTNPNVTPPPGGYGDKNAEARFNASRPEKQLTTQYGMGQDNRVAMTEVPSSSYGGNVYPSSDPNAFQNPSQYAPNIGGVTQHNYQHTSIQQTGMIQPGMEQNPHFYQQPNTDGLPTGGYSPLPHPPTYDTLPPQGFAPPTATGFESVPQNSFGANPSHMPSYGTGYPAVPPTGGFH